MTATLDTSPFLAPQVLPHEELWPQAPPSSPPDRQAPGEWLDQQRACLPHAWESGMAWTKITTQTCLSELQALTQPSGNTNGASGAGGHGDGAAERAHLGELAAMIRELEQLKCAAQAAQAALAVRLDTGTRRREAALGVPAARQGRSVAHEVALARRTSPYWGRVHLGLAKLLPAELSHTWEAFRTGRITEQTALAIMQETAGITCEARLEIDRLLASDPDRLEQRSVKQIRQEAAAHAARLDNPGVAARRRRAAAGRHVTVTPAPDAMSRLTITVPVAQGVAAYAALKKHTDRLLGTDPAAAATGRGAVMADTAITRLTGQTAADHIPVRINLIMNHADLFGSPNRAAAGGTVGAGSTAGSTSADQRPEPNDSCTGVGADASAEASVGAWITERGIGTFGLTTPEARHLIAQALRAQADGAHADGAKVGVFLRRLYTHPDTGHLIAMDARSRHVPTALADFITQRDQTCSTPWCDAPIRHIDHIHPAADGGPTTVINLQGLCEACNHAKQAPGWRQTSHLDPDGRLVITTDTPAGQQLTTSPPRAG